ncbi:HER024Cp [Eremothecium sinecaudum]|uniref:HER024Cp n=1 Tax=Eremothecium sinecaudum TaxID=45286 RepID=A0A109UZT6_9SACH|nr:HER024Cp [Eremothecium sinecaudum]AMD21303.1 HER024Cp [Eremothecium sinecaudum]
MFRLVQHTQVLKSRVPNHLASASKRNSFKFNSTVTRERPTSPDPAPPLEGTLAGSKQGSGNICEKQELNAGQVLGIHKNVKLNDKKFNSGQNSPWKHKRNAFNEYVNNTFDSNNRRFSGDLTPVRASLFWDSITKAVTLYKELSAVSGLDALQVGRFVSMLHTGLRVNRDKLIRLNAKPDYDANSFYSEMTTFLCESLRSVKQDILSQKVEVSDHGAFHLLQSFKELLLEREAYDTWLAAINSGVDSLSTPFMSATSLGSVLPLLQNYGHTFEQICSLYDRARIPKKGALSHLLALGFIRAALEAGENAKALEVFQELCENSKQGVSRSILTGVHVAFIGDCKDLMIATTFFERSTAGDVPYKINVPVSAVKKLINRTWNERKDFKAVYDLWIKALLYYGDSISAGVCCSLNSELFTIFFEHHMEEKIKGANHLRKIIDSYSKIRPIDETFLNVILTKCAVWKDRQIITSIEESYDHYGVTKTIVTYRILLKALGSINASTEEIYGRWIALLKKTDKSKYSYIANADWAALRDATLSCFRILKTDLAKESVKIDNYNPALEAANASGAFDDDILTTNSTSSDANLVISDERLEEMVVFYYSVATVFRKYCRDNEQYVRYTNGITEFIPEVLPYLAKNTKKIQSAQFTVPEFRYIRVNI